MKDAKNNTVIADNNYTYNNANQITQNIDQSGTHAYGYDSLDRLTSATYTGTAAESYAYDGVGNRTNSQRSSTYSYQPFNRLTGTSTASYLYNNNGNMISKSDLSGTTQFAWDFENRLTQVVTPASGSVTYKYDALGRRIQSAPSSGASTNFTYDGDDVAQDKTSTNVITEYLNGPGIDNKIRQKTGNTLYYFAQDHLGSTTALTDSKGALAERETYDAYGNTVGSTRTRFGYTGRERDSLTGLQYNRARFYDPQLGRFISEDPINLGGGINFNAYVAGNPVNLVDPLGLQHIRPPRQSMEPADLVKDCRVRAMLEALAWSEGTAGDNDSGYGRVVFGVVVKAPYNPELVGQSNVRITDFSRHPQISVKFRETKPNISTAAGRYQFLFGTWEGLGLPDFSASNQDIGAVMLLKQRRSIQPLLDCDLEKAVSQARGEWASLPGSPYGQPTREMTDFQKVYDDARAKCEAETGPCSCRVH